MPAERPAWRHGFDLVDNAVGPRLKAVVNSDAFAIAVGLATRAEHTVRVRSERATRHLLHLWNLPAGSDITRVLHEIGRLQQQVGELSRQFDAKGERQNGATSSRQRSARPRST